MKKIKYLRLLVLIVGIGISASSVSASDYVECENLCCEEEQMKWEVERPPTPKFKEIEESEVETNKKMNDINNNIKMNDINNNIKMNDINNNKIQSYNNFINSTGNLYNIEKNNLKKYDLKKYDLSKYDLNKYNYYLLRKIERQLGLRFIDKENFDYLVTVKKLNDFGELRFKKVTKDCILSNETNSEMKKKIEKKFDNYEKFIKEILKKIDELLVNIYTKTEKGKRNIFVDGNSKKIDVFAERVVKEFMKNMKNEYNDLVIKDVMWKKSRKVEDIFKELKILEKIKLLILLYTKDVNVYLYKNEDEFQIDLTKKGSFTEVECLNLKFISDIVNKIFASYNYKKDGISLDKGKEKLKRTIKQIFQVFEKIDKGETVSNWKKIEEILYDCALILNDAMKFKSNNAEFEFYKKDMKNLEGKKNDFEHLKQTVKHNLVNDPKLFMKDLYHLMKNLCFICNEDDVVYQDLFDVKVIINEMLRQLRVTFEQILKNYDIKNYDILNKKNKFIQDRNVQNKFGIGKVDFFNLDFEKIEKDEQKLRIIEDKVKKLFKSIKDSSCDIKTGKCTLNSFEKYFFLIKQMDLDYESRIKNYEGQRNKIQRPSSKLLISKAKNLKERMKIIQREILKKIQLLIKQYEPKIKNYEVQRNKIQRPSSELLISEAKNPKKIQFYEDIQFYEYVVKEISECENNLMLIEMKTNGILREIAEQSYCNNRIESDLYFLRSNGEYISQKYLKFMDYRELYNLGKKNGEQFEQLLSKLLVYKIGELTEKIEKIIETISLTITKIKTIVQ